MHRSREWPYERARHLGLPAFHRRFVPVVAAVDAYRSSRRA
ncbi:hypothetical protein AB0C59_17840 [Streptomyces sp. NPDC048664]